MKIDCIEVKRISLKLYSNGYRPWSKAVEIAEEIVENNKKYKAASYYR